MEFISGEQKYFFEFLNNLKKKDRVGIVSHTDLDGISSAIIAEKVLKDKKIKPKSFAFINYEKGVFQKVKKKFSAKKIKKILIFDINIESDYENFKELDQAFDVFVVDHHPSSIASQTNILKTGSFDCTTFTLFELLKKDFNLNQLKELVCATMLVEYSFKSDSNFSFMKENYPDLILEDIFNSTLGKISSLFSSPITYFGGKAMKAFLVIKKIIKKRNVNLLLKYKKIIEKEIASTSEKFVKEAEYYPEKNLYFYYSPLKFGVSSIIVSELSSKQPEKTFIFVSDITNKPDFVKVSSRNNSGKIDLNTLMKKGVEGLKEAMGGGHVAASGASFMKKDLDKFKQNILNAL
jgi:single-stranded DNA-specific DHH superfamily exonuclease